MFAIPWAQKGHWNNNEDLWHVDERIQMSPIQVRNLDVENASHLWRLEVMRVKSRARGSSWRFDFRMLKNPSMRGVK